MLIIHKLVVKIVCTWIEMLINYYLQNRKQNITLYNFSLFSDCEYVRNWITPRESVLRTIKKHHAEYNNIVKDEGGKLVSFWKILERHAWLGSVHKKQLFIDYIT